MKLIYAKSNWEMSAAPLEAFLQRVYQDGFEATEVYLQPLPNTPDEVAGLHENFGLSLVGQIISQGSTPQEHLRSLEEQFEFARRCRPVLINGHLGRDIFTFTENVHILERALQLGAGSGIPFVVETHRGRPTYSAIETRRYLEALPDLHLAADFSHWMVVHESDLSDQSETMDLALDRSRHIHARVGYAEGPQVPDPRAPEWKSAVQTHLKLWQGIVDRRKAAGDRSLYITPEFGPPAYMHTLPFSNQPVADVWEINAYMKELLKEALIL